MASIKLQGDTSGELTISAPAVAGTNTLTLPASTGTLLTTTGDGSALTSLPVNGIGVGQTWQEVTGSRSVGTTYTNSTGKPIQLYISVQCNTVTAQAYCTINGSIIVKGNMTNNVNIGSLISAIIPNGATYVITQTSGGTATIHSWQELR